MTDSKTMTMARKVATDVLNAKGIKIVMRSEIAVAYHAILAERERAGK